MTEIGNNLLKLILALLKHQVKKSVGEEALGIVAQTLVDIGGEKTQASIDSMLGTHEGIKKLLDVATKADACFREKCDDKDLLDAFTIPMGDLVSVQHALRELPNTTSEDYLLKTIQDNLQRDFPILTQDQIKTGSNIYVACLRQALLPLKNYTLQIIGQATLRSEEKLNEVGLDVHEIKHAIKNLSSIEKRKPLTYPPTGTIPAGSYIPFIQNTLFTGRKNILEKLASNFQVVGKRKKPNLAVSQLITGMGGVGKTQLAIEFAHRYGHRFKGVHWLDLSDPSALDAQIALCGAYMGLSFTNQHEQVAATIKIWQNENPRLLILDDLEDIGQIHDILAKFQHLPLHIIITSRRTDFPKSIRLQRQEVDIFSAQESADFLQIDLDKRESTKSRKKLAERLGNLPLALSLAAGYINVNQLTISNYLKQLDNLIEHESMQKDWFKELDLSSPTKHHLSLHETFQLSWQMIKDETQQKVFALAGHCAPNTPIPLDVFRRTLNLDDQSLSKALYRLRGFNLLQTINLLPSIHPLLSEYAEYTRDPKDDLPEMLGNVLGELSYHALVTEIPSNFLPFRLHIKRVASYSQDINPQLAGILWNHYGNHLRDSGEYKEGEIALRRALLLCETSFGKDHPVTGTVLASLGSIFAEMEKTELARNCFERALKISISANGYKHRATARDLNNLARVLRELGDINNAQKHMLMALKIDEDLFGSDSIETAKDFNNLAFVYLDQNKLLESKSMLERCIQIYKSNSESEHPNVGIALYNLGGILKDLGMLEDAKNSLEDALIILERVFPPNHPKIQLTRSNLNWLIERINSSNF